MRGSWDWVEIWSRKFAALFQDRAEFFPLSSAAGGGRDAVETGDISGGMDGPE